MTDKNILDLDAGVAILGTDLFLSRQGADTEDKSVSATQIKTFTTTTANQQSAIAVGTAYSLTATSAALDFGTTDPSITLTEAGTYLLFFRVQLDYNGATFAANRNVTLKARRTNNTAGDLTGGSNTYKTGIVTTFTETFISAEWFVLYTTVNTDDAITIFGNIDVLPSAGTLDAVSASVVAIRLQQ